MACKDNPIYYEKTGIALKLELHKSHILYDKIVKIMEEYKLSKN